MKRSVKSTVLNQPRAISSKRVKVSIDSLLKDDKIKARLESRIAGCDHRIKSLQGDDPVKSLLRKRLCLSKLKLNISLSMVEARIAKKAGKIDKRIDETMSILKSKHAA